LAKRRRGRQTRLGRLRQNFLAGLFIVTPLVITVWVLNILFGLVHGISTPLILNIFRLLHVEIVDDPAFATYAVPLIGLTVTLVVIFSVGFLATNLFGKRLVAAFDQLMLRIPVIKSIYGGTRQLLDAFNATSGSFRRVVAVEYPRPGVYTLGFVARESTTIRAEEGKPLADHALVFLPTTPNPTSGWLAVIPAKDLIPLNLSVEDGIKVIVSGGIVVPSDWEGK
jgi:uncharacterized membrane protein